MINPCGASWLAEESSESSEHSKNPQKPRRLCKGRYDVDVRLRKYSPYSLLNWRPRANS